MNAALGVRPLEAGGQWAEMPKGLPAPDECARRPLRFEVDESINTRLDVRVAKLRDFSELDGTPGDGRTVMWARMPEVLDMSGAALAILGDYVPLGVGQALGLLAGGNSLDNTLRVARLVPTEWVLLDIRVHAVDHGFGHGLVHLWARGRHAARDREPVVHRPLLEAASALTAEVARLIFGTDDLVRVTDALSSWTRCRARCAGRCRRAVALVGGRRRAGRLGRRAASRAEGVPGPLDGTVPPQRRDRAATSERTGASVSAAARRTSAP